MAATRTSTTPTGDEGFSAQERAAMKERAKEVRASKRGPKVDPEEALLAAVAQLPEAERAIAERVHAIVREAAPDLAPKLWYGMPSYARGGKVVVFFQAASKFDTRYSTLGFNDLAALDDGNMWPVAYALTKLTKGDEKRIADLVKRAAG